LVGHFSKSAKVYLKGNVPVGIDNKPIKQALLSIKDKYGKNAIVKGLNMQEGATAMERNKQVGGHKA